ncbi:MAG: hypothetical protein AVDCRST_MAG59-3187, partial [uncultured Thermomicrobiales bacterium]
ARDWRDRARGRAARGARRGVQPGGPARPLGRGPLLLPEGPDRRL